MTHYRKFYFLIYFFLLITTLGTSQSTIPVNWINDVNVSFTSTTIYKPGSGGGSWDAGANSSQILGIDEIGFVEFEIPDITKNLNIGFSTSNANHALNDLEYGVLINSSQAKVIFEGVDINTTQGIVNDDLLRVERTNSEIQWSVNGVIFHTETIVSKPAVNVDCGIGAYDGRINNTVVNFDVCNPGIGTPCDDGNACTIDDVIQSDCSCLGTPIIPNAIATVINESCTSGNGHIELDVSGGEIPYTYSWSTGAVAKDIYDLSAGSYSVTITGFDGCSNTYSFDIIDDLSCCDEMYIEFIPAGTEYSRIIESGVTQIPDKVDILENTSTGEIEMHYSVTEHWDFDNTVLATYAGSPRIKAWTSYQVPVVDGTYIKELRLISTGGSLLDLIIDPTVGNYLNGPYGTLVESDLIFDSTNSSLYADAVSIQLKNAIHAELGFDDLDDYELESTINNSETTLRVRFLAKNRSPWAGIPKGSPYFMYYDGTQDVVENNQTTGYFIPKVTIETQLPEGATFLTLYATLGLPISVVDFDNVIVTESIKDVVLLTGTTDITSTEPALAVIDYCEGATFDWENLTENEFIINMAELQDYSVVVECPDGCEYILEFNCGPEGTACDDGNPCTFNDTYVENCGCEGTLGLELVNTTLVNEFCTGGDGSIDLTLNGASSNINILWSNGEVTEDLVGLSVGNYTVTITDMNNPVCELIESFVIEDISGPCCNTALDYHALMALYNSTNGPNWNNNSGWVDGAQGVECDPCSWHGVTCNVWGRVTELKLQNNNLTGTIPPEIGQLDKLTLLNLNNNSLSGSIPSEIGELVAIRHLYLHLNMLSGSIPSEIGQMPYLRNLYAQNNQLSGSIPSEIGNASLLNRILLQNNQLTGNIPSTIGSLIDLRQLKLFNNALTGSIPEEIGDLKLLWYLSIFNNQISGEIPPEMGGMTKLRECHLQNNDISGPIPEEFGQLQELTRLHLNSNNLSGRIPSSLGGLSLLRTFYAYNNELSGYIPGSLGDLSLVTSIRLFNNNLSGCIPQNLDKLCGKDIDLRNNPCLSHDGIFADFCTDSACTLPMGENCPCTTQTQPSGTEIIGERGKITATENWLTVLLENQYDDPVIIVGPATNTEGKAIIAEVNNVNSYSFEIRLKDWSCTLNNVDEMVSYMVVESGTYALEDGTRLIASNESVYQTNGASAIIPEGWNPTVVMSQLTSVNDMETANSRAYDIDGSGEQYEIIIQEAKTAQAGRPYERVSMLAIEESESSTGEIFQVKRLNNNVSDTPSSITFNTSYCDPVFIAKMNSDVDLDPAELSIQSESLDDISVFVNEDNACGSQSDAHALESMGYVLFDGPGLIFGDPIEADLVVDDMTCPSGITTGDLMELDVDISNLGVFDAEIFKLGIYLSQDASLDPFNSDDILLGSTYVLGSEVGSTQTVTTTVNVPVGLSGDYFLFAFADNAFEVKESNENNNTLSCLVTITVHPCANGIQDNGETGIDCGGPCENVCPEEIDWSNVCLDARFTNETFDREIDVNLAVGKIGGVANVSPTGNASYSIPITLPPGTNNMVPVVSLGYNSSAKNGIAGFGWNLSASSVITRTNRNIYYNGKVAPVTLTNDDALVLDGKRLLPIDENETTITEYGLEVEDFSRITPQGNAGNGPAWFQQILKSGLIIEFGNSGDSKIVASDGTVISWAVSKMMDQYGNYLEYVYSDNNYELLLEQINYTGNDAMNLDPYNSIEFMYADRGDESTSYIGGTELKFDKLLTKIEVKAGSDLVRVFDLCHAPGPIVGEGTLGESAGIRSYLTEIQQSGSEGGMLNSTRFKYGEKTNTTEVVTLSNLLEKHPADYVKIGDLNADGLDDVAIFRSEFENDISIARGVAIYLKTDRNSDNFAYLGYRPLDEYLEKAGKKSSIWSTVIGFLLYIGFDKLLALVTGTWWLQLIIMLLHVASSILVTLFFGGDVLFGNFTFDVNDFNGDNREEIILYSPVYDSDDLEEKVFTIGVSELNEIIVTEYPFVRPNKDWITKDFLIGDYDGDTKLDIGFVLYDKETDDDQIVTQMKIGLSSHDHTFYDVQFDPALNLSISALTKTRILSCELDGDGKSDFLISGGNINPTGSVPMTLDIEGTNIVMKDINGNGLTQLNYPKKEDLVYLGDFNGDGKSDVLTSSLLHRFQVGYFTGDDFIRIGMPIELNNVPQLEYSEESETVKVRDNSSIFISDFNNDNLTDILILPGGSNINFQRDFNIYYSSGNSFTKEIISNDFQFPITVSRHERSYKFDYGDFNGDAIMDILSTGHHPEFGGYQLKYINKENEDHLLTDVLDGFNNLTSFEYKSMTDNTVYQETESIRLHKETGPLEYLDIEYPVSRIINGHKLVSKMYSPNSLLTGQKECQYTYQNAIYHRVGKGFSGMANFNKVDINLNREFISNFHYNEDFASIVPAGGGIKTWDYGQVTQSSLPTFDIEPHTLNSKRYHFNQTYVSSIDFVKSRRSATNYIYTTAFENIEMIKTIKYKNAGNEIFTETTTYSDFDSNGSWMPNKPKHISKILEYKDEAPFTVNTEISYNANGSILNKKTFPGLAKELNFEYTDYDGFGNSNKIIQSNPNLENRETTFYFDNKGQFIESVEDALGNISTLQYDSKWGAIKSVTDITGNTISINFDEFGREIAATSITGVSSTTIYDWDVRNGNGTNLNSADDALYFVENTHPSASDSKTIYNSLGMTRESIQEDFSSDGSSIDLYQNYKYDLRGRLVAQNVPYHLGQASLETQIGYDEFNRPIAITSPTGTSSINYVNLTEGNYKIVMNLEDGNQKTNTTDIAGKLIESYDTGDGKVTRSYYSHGGTKEVSINDEVIMSMLYDEYGRQTGLIEVNSGTSTYEYNAYNELIYQDDSRNTYGGTIFGYDVLGRISTCTKPEGLTTYDYVTIGNGLTQIEKITNYNGIVEEFEYDQYNRNIKKTETIFGETFTTENVYNNFNQVTKRIYPSNLSIDYEYITGSGYLKKVLNENGHTLFEPLESNNYGNLTRFNRGNGTESIIDYDAFGILKREYTTDNGTHDLEYNINAQNGVMNSRKDNLLNLEEVFTYDDHYRLTSAQVLGNGLINYDYAANGNLELKTDISNDPYVYDNTKIHAITEVQDILINDYSVNNITYTSFSQPIQINEGAKTLDFEYGSSDQRKYVSFTDLGNPDLDFERYYIGDYEYLILGEDTYKVHYLDGGVIAVSENGAPANYFYTYSDHLGSIVKVTNDQGVIVAKQNFDSWGTRRNPLTWVQEEVDDYVLPWLIRGYTGHEMVPEFDLVNMNGRLYDPIISRMLSPDNFGGQNGTSQSFNRYSYVYNNPISYTDPDGEWPIPGISFEAFNAWLDGPMAQGLLANISNAPVAEIVAQGTGFSSGLLGKALGATVSNSIYNSSVPSIPKNYPMLDSSPDPIFPIYSDIFDESSFSAIGSASTVANVLSSYGAIMSSIPTPPPTFVDQYGKTRNISTYAIQSLKPRMANERVAFGRMGQAQLANEALERNQALNKKISKGKLIGNTAGIANIGMVFLNAPNMSNTEFAGEFIVANITGNPWLAARYGISAWVSIPITLGWEGGRYMSNHWNLYKRVKFDYQVSRGMISDTRLITTGEKPGSGNIWFR